MESGLITQDKLSGVNPSAGAAPLPESDALSKLGANVGFPLTGQLANEVDDRKSQEQTVSISIGYKEMGKYLISLSGRMLENLDEIYDSDLIVKSGTTDAGYVFTNSKETLELDCFSMAAAGHGLWLHRESIEEEFGNGPAFIKGKLQDGNFVVEDIDWDEFQKFLTKVGDKYSDYEGQENFDGDPMCFSDFAMAMGDSGYGPNSTFFPKEVSLLVNPVKK
ncbi:MAG: hypothetical protein AAFN93_18105 [Bacteroidota bacterium]